MIRMISKLLLALTSRCEYLLSLKQQSNNALPILIAFFPVQIFGASFDCDDGMRIFPNIVGTKLQGRSRRWGDLSRYRRSNSQSDLRFLLHWKNQNHRRECYENRLASVDHGLSPHRTEVQRLLERQYDSVELHGNIRAGGQIRLSAIAQKSTNSHLCVVRISANRWFAVSSIYIFLRGTEVQRHPSDRRIHFSTNSGVGGARQRKSLKLCARIVAIDSNGKTFGAGTIVELRKIAVGHWHTHFSFNLRPQFLHDVAEAFTDKHDCFEVVLYEYRRRALYGENDKTVTLHRNMTPTAENLFAVSGQNSTVTIEKFNANSKTWRKFCEINVQSPEYESNLMLVWNEYFMFCIGGRSTGRYTFVRAVSVAVRILHLVLLIWCMDADGCYHLTLKRVFTSFD